MKVYRSRLHWSRRWYLFVCFRFVHYTSTLVSVYQHIEGDRFNDLIKQLLKPLLRSRYSNLTTWNLAVLCSFVFDWLMKNEVREYHFFIKRVICFIIFRFPKDAPSNFLFIKRQVMFWLQICIAEYQVCLFLIGWMRLFWKLFLKRK